MSKFYEGRMAVVPRSSITFGSRKREEYGDVSAFAKEIDTDGLIHPPAVRELPDGTYELACGGRRLKALDLLEWVEIPVSIFPPDTDDLTFRILELKENISRKDYTWHEIVTSKADIHKLMIQKFGDKKNSRDSRTGHSIRDTAKLLNESHVNVLRDLELADKLEMIPALKNYENKNQATKALETAGKRVQTAEALKVIKRDLATKPEDVLKTRLINSYVVGDFFTNIKALPAEHYDLVDLDPPYGIDFENPGSARDQSHLRADFVEVPDSDYPKLLENTLRECYRVMKPHSWLIVWFASDPWAEVTYQAIINAGFKCSRYTGIWKKGIQKGFAPDQRGRLSQSYEPFYYARKGDPGFTKTGRYAVFDFEPTPPSEKSHPTEKPIALLEEIIHTYTMPGASVLVPYAGSGNTLLAANNCKCNAIGFDLSAHYKDLYTKRVHEGQIGAYK